MYGPCGLYEAKRLFIEGQRVRKSFLRQECVRHVLSFTGWLFRLTWWLAEAATSGVDQTPSDIKAVHSCAGTNMWLCESMRVCAISDGRLKGYGRCPWILMVTGGSVRSSRALLVSTTSLSVRFLTSSGAQDSPGEGGGWNFVNATTLRRSRWFWSIDQ